MAIAPPVWASDIVFNPFFRSMYNNNIINIIAMYFIDVMYATADFSRMIGLNIIPHR